MALVTFDGENRLILCNVGTLTLDVERDLYSAWKDWTRTGNNAKYPPAFRTIGGDPIGGGLVAGKFFFLQNQDNWRIRAQETDHTLDIVGNLYPENVALPMFNYTVGDYKVQVQLSRSPLTLGVDGNVPTVLQAIKLKTDLLNNQKGQPLANFPVVMVDAEDHVTPAPGLAVYGEVSLDGAAYVPLSNAIAEVGQGHYRVDLTGAEMNGTSVTLRFTAAGADPRYITLLPEA